MKPFRLSNETVSTNRVPVERRGGGARQKRERGAAGPLEVDLQKVRRRVSAPPVDGDTQAVCGPVATRDELRVIANPLADAGPVWHARREDEESESVLGRGREAVSWSFYPPALSLCSLFVCACVGILFAGVLVCRAARLVRG